jgi:hypothetical protein
MAGYRRLGDFNMSLLLPDDLFTTRPTHRQDPDTAVTSETNPDNLSRALEMKSAHPERAVKSDSFNRRPR